MAEAFETVDVILTAEQAAYINDRHVDRTQHLRTAKFFLLFNLSATLGLLSRRTWETRDDVELMNEGWKRSWALLLIRIRDWKVRRDSPLGLSLLRDCCVLFSQSCVLRQVPDHHCLSFHYYLPQLFYE